MTSDFAGAGKKTVLVAGGAGYIGSHACKALSKAGYLPVTYDNLVYGHEWAVKWGPLELGDILDRGRLDEVIAKYQPQAIIHFAAFTYVGESVSDPGKYYRNNVVGSLNLIEAARDHGIRQLCVFKHRRRLRNSRPDAYRRGDAAAARQPLRRFQIHGGAHAGGFRIRRMGSDRLRFDISMRPAPILKTRLARITIPSRI